MLGLFMGGVLFALYYTWADTYHYSLSRHLLYQLPPVVWLDAIFWLGFALFYMWCLRVFARYVQDVWRSGKILP